MMESLHVHELPLIRALQAWGLPWWIIEPMSSFGVETIMAVGVILYFGYSRRLGLRLIALYFLTDILNVILKVACHSSRPYWVDSEVKNLSYRGEHATYGFPSGHAQNASAAWINLAIYLKESWAWIAAGLFIVLVSFSRVYLGVHFISDVVGGVLIGTILAVFMYVFEPKVIQTVRPWPVWAKVIALLAFAPIVMCVAWMIYQHTPADPATWAEKSKAARSIARLGTPVGALTGLGLAALISSIKGINFDAGGSWSQRFWRIAIGGGMVGGIIKFTHLWRFEGIKDFAWRFALGCGLAIWVGLIAPWLFIRVGLARRL